jgi:predicted ATPase/DNA-binding XRE family transcriptional regulator
VPAQRVTGGDAFGDRLRSLRERAGLSQEELANRAGVTPNAVSALERGTRTRPYPHTVRSLADALRLSESERAELIDSVPKRRTSSSEPEVAPAGGSDWVGGGDTELSLVVPPTPLFGRDADIANIVQLAQSGRSRFLTLTGPGGVGKTRLAMAVCRELAADYPNRVFPISLAALTDADEVVGTIARAAKLTWTGGENGLAVLTHQLGARGTLLVLDNFEHLLSAAIDVGRLVASCDNLTVLVTSRSPLRVRGEQEYVVPPLTLPAPEVSSVDALAGSAAGAFVLHRAQEIASVAVVEDDARALGELCRRLAGLPLAIELATAHLRLLPPQALLARLDQIRAAGPRDLPERQRTMRATLDWSYRLLSEPEQKLFRLLSVFRGGGTLTAVEEVAARCGSVPPEDVLGLLEALVEQSLVVVRRNSELDQRFDMLEPVAQYARTSLLGREAASAVRAHSGTFLELAEQAAAGYEGADQLGWLNRIEADEANLLVAIDRSLDGGDGETAGRITWAMWLYWWLRSKPLVGLRRALRCLAADLPPHVRTRVHLAAATTSYAAGQVPASAEHWEEAFRLAAQHSDSTIIGAARAGTGLAALALGDLDRAADLFREALPLTEQANDMWMTSLIHVWLGTISLVKNNPVDARDEIGRGLELARARGDRLATYVALYNLAQAAIAEDDHVGARVHLTEGIVLSEQNHDLANLAYFLEALAIVESAEQAADRVPVLLGAAQTLRESTDNKSYGYYLPDESLLEQVAQRTRQSLGEDGYADAVQTGRDLDVTDVVRFAVNSADRG